MSKVLYNQFPAPHQSALLKFNADTNAWTPFITIADANANIPSGRRYRGMQVMIGGILHIYQAGILDADLLPLFTFVPPIQGTASGDFLYTFTTVGVLREAVFHAGAPGSFTIRQNGDADTDYLIELGAGYRRYHFLGMPTTAGSTIEILNPTTAIDYIFYTA